MSINTVKWVVKWFLLLGSCTRWQLGDGGVQPPLVRIFGGLERKLRCAQNIVF